MSDLTTKVIEWVIDIRYRLVSNLRQTLDISISQSTAVLPKQVPPTILLVIKIVIKIEIVLLVIKIVGLCHSASLVLFGAL